MELTPKERFLRGFDALGAALPGYVHPRMQEATGDKPWFPAHLALESERGRYTKNLDPKDPREMLTVLQRYPGVFAEVDEDLGWDLRQLSLIANNAAHASKMSARQSEEGLEKCLYVASTLGLQEPEAAIRALQEPAQQAAGPEAGPTQPGTPLSTGQQGGAAGTLTERTDVRSEVEVGDEEGVVTFESESYLVRARFLTALNYALSHNSVSPLPEITVQNVGTSDLRAVELRFVLVGAGSLKADGFGEKIVVLSSVPTSSSRAVETKDLLWHIPDSFFASATEAWNVELQVHLHIAGEFQAMQSVPMTVHPADEWWMGNTGEALCSFVRPNEGIVSELLSKVSDELYRETGEAELLGYQRGPDRVRATAAATYRVLLSAGIDYVEPPPSFKVGSQRIRGHREVIEKKLGTCLDLAVLYAAILEAAGIAPVLVLGKKHAFAGYLLEDTQLSESFVTIDSAIHTITQSDMFESVELTALTGRGNALSFEDAESVAAGWWPNRIDEVVGLIDVRAAHRWFRPLPAITERDGVLVVEKVVAPPERKQATGGEGVSYSRVTESAPQRVERWKKSLLDLSFRNPLLKIRRTSGIPLLMPPRGAGLLEDQVSGDCTIVVKPDGEIRSHNGARVDLTDVAVQESLLQEIGQGETVFTDVSDSLLERRVTALRRRARESREETGADSLYLALGMLEWKEGANTGAAPVFLLPIVLRGGRRGERATFTFDHSRELEPNYCLYEKLKGTYNLEISELLDPGNDSSGIDLDGAFARIRTKLAKAGASQFSLQEDAVISTFQFSTLTMWRDLDDNWSTLIESAPVRHLVENSGGAPSPLMESPGTADRLKETEAYAPLPLDSAQLAAIDLASQGASFVLEGPPGTGKSQTITNMIAHSLAEGQRVLFVAEKQAALDVVKRRLDAVGLSKFVLELHGEQQTQTSVREHLQASLDEVRSAQRDFGSAGRTYGAAVDYLNSYARKIHVEGTSGMSLWSAHQAVLTVAQNSSHAGDPIELSSRLVLQTSSVETLKKLANDIEAAMLALDGLPGQSAWSIVDPSANLTEANLRDLPRLLATLSELHGQLSDNELRLIGASKSRDEADAVFQWMEACLEGMQVIPEQAFHAKTGWLAGIRDALPRLAQEVSEKNPQNLGFSVDVLDLDLDHLTQRSREADAKMFGKNKKRAPIMDELRPFASGPLDPNALTATLTHLVTLRDYGREWRNHLSTHTGFVIPTDFSVYEPNHIERINGEMLAWEVASSLGEVLSVNAALNEALQSVGTFSEAGLRRLQRISNAWWGFRSAAGVSGVSEVTWLDGRAWHIALQDSLDEWMTDVYLDLKGLRGYATAAALLSRLEDLGVREFSKKVWSGHIPAMDISDEMDRAIYGAVRAERMQAQGLRNFDSEAREMMASRFIESAEEYRHALESQISQKILANRDRKLHHEAERELRAQLGQRRNAMSIRRLMSEYFPAISATTPCFLMSPSSVAKFLPARSDLFDLVIFDEASQIRVPQAIGAMGRGRSAVIVGDSQQMPPSSMFMTRNNDDDEAEDSVEDQAVVPVDMESILSEAVESNFNRKMLLWHYRSRDESLIAFSNGRYYEDRLASFPSPPRDEGASLGAVSLVRVDGKWEGGARAARVNQEEAEAIVSAVVCSLEDDPKKSIGVITFNIQQRNWILDLLERRAATSDALAKALAREDAPVFVKNLENVQGDERDVIFFSLAFSPDENGRIPLNWGPLSRSGGEKRLNVAVTRAKEKVVVFASFDPREFDLGASRSVGLKHLKEYLLQAQDARLQQQSKTWGTIDQHHEEVFRALTRAGLDVRQKIGLSDFVLDIAVAAPGKQWLGILLEGPDWYGRFSVSDREGLPRDVLVHQMGWAAVRTVSLPEWIKDSASVVESIVEEAQLLPLLAEDDADALLGEGRGRGKFPEGSTQGQSQRERLVPMVRVAEVVKEQPRRLSTEEEEETRSDSVSRDEVPQSDVAQGADEGSPLPFRSADTEMRHPRSVLDEDPTLAASLIAGEALEVIETEGPISEGRLLNILGLRFDLQRLKGPRREQFRTALPASAAVADRLGAVFYWPRGVDPSTYGGYRERGIRATEDIALEEIANAMRHVRARAPHLDEEGTFKRTRELFDIGRLGNKIKPRFDAAYQVVIEGH